MQTLKLRNPEKMLFALLRAALHQREVEETYFQQATESDWLECFRLSVRQGVSALAWGAIGRLPAKYSPPLEIKLSWALVEQKQVKKYREHCLTVQGLTGYLARNGIAAMVLKGVGLSRLYPIPAHREGGDIDIYTYSADRSKMTDEQASLRADELMLAKGAVTEDSTSKKHSAFYLNGISFENHKMFLHLAECKTTAKAEQWLKKHFETQKAELLDGEISIEVPSPAFDKVFIALHAAQHYASGLSLKHLCDWAMLVKQTGVQLPEDLDDRYLKRTITVLTQLCSEHLGLDIKAEGEERLAEEMMQEILHPPYYRQSPTGGPFKKRSFELKNRIHIFRKQHNLLGVSFWGKIRGLMVRKIKNNVTKRGRA